MLRKNKNAVICGAGGAIGGAVARGFARKGAKVSLILVIPSISLMYSAITGGTSDSQSFPS